MGRVAANNRRPSAAIIASHGKVGKGGQSAQGGSGGCDGGPRQACSDHDPFTDCVGDYQAHISATSEGEAFACACVLLALLEAQP